MRVDDTIAALGSAAGPAERGIVRVSGVDARRCVGRVMQADDGERWQTERRAGCHRGMVRLSASRVLLPVLAYLWPNRQSYTGEPMVELHMAGSPPLLEAALSELYAAGVRPARPGEFTLRSFLAGRIDLVQAEAVLGIVDAHDHRELEAALAQLAGGISKQLASVRTDLLDLLADLEAGLDFVDEDIQFVTSDEAAGRIAGAERELEVLLAQASARLVSTGRSRVVLAGLPNAGKSTLFNALVGREAALVSEIKGTTRDYLSAALECGGVTFDLVDTAGWEAGVEGIARTAQELRSEQVERADLVLWCSAADLTPAERAVDAACCDVLRRCKGHVLRVATKFDVESSNPMTADVRVSARTGSGLAELLAAAAARLTVDTTGGRQFVGSSAARCRESLTGALSALAEGRVAAVAKLGDEIVALEVRAALEHLGTILGAVYTDDILDRIFSRFCIGK